MTTPNVTYDRSCANKVPYQNITDGQDVIRTLVNNGIVPNRSLVSYHCRYCDKFHIGHPVRKDESIPVKKFRK